MDPLPRRLRSLLPSAAIAALATLPFLGVAQRAEIAWAPGGWLSASRLAQVSTILAERNAHPRFLMEDFLLLLALLAAAAGYAVALHHSQRVQACRRHFILLFGGALTLSVLLWFVPNLLSGDVYSYALYGRVVALHAGNPFVQPPAHFAFDPFLTRVTWKQVPSIYGPVWMLICATVTWTAELFGGSLGTYVLLYKAVATAAHLAGGVCIVAIMGIVAPARRLFAATLYVLNPLALIEFAMNAHNDAVMVLAMLLGVYFSLRPAGRAEFLAALAFSLACFAKWTAGAALLLYGVRALAVPAGWPARVHTFGRFSAAFMLAALCYLPFWRGMQTFDAFGAVPSLRRAINSLAEVALRLLLQKKRGLGTDLLVFSEAEIGRMIGLHNALWLASHVLLGLAVLWAVIGVARRRVEASVATAWVLFAYCVTTLWFWPWYASWVLAFGAVSPFRGIGKTAVIFSLCAPLTYVLHATPWVGLFAIGLPLAWLLVDRTRPTRGVRLELG
jgi:hypothetical protein